MELICWRPARLSGVRIKNYWKRPHRSGHVMFAIVLCLGWGSQMPCTQESVFCSACRQIMDTTNGISITTTWERMREPGSDTEHNLYRWAFCLRQFKNYWNSFLDTQTRFWKLNKQVLNEEAPLKWKEPKHWHSITICVTNLIFWVLLIIFG